MPRHFLTGAELSSQELDALLTRAVEMKAEPLAARPLDGRSVALLFEKPSTRTRLSFEAGVFELGGHPLVLRGNELQLSRGESVRDTALVFSRHVAAIGWRTGPDALIEELAEHSGVPVVNMLTAGHHPVQALADLLTLREAFGRVEGLKLAYVGDGNNVARSLAILGSRAGVDVWVAAPEGYQLEADVPATLVTDPAEDGERARDVVAVADVGQAAAVEGAERLAHRHQVGERLARVMAGREHVEDGDVGVLGELLEQLVGAGPDADRGDVP